MLRAKRIAVDFDALRETFRRGGIRAALMEGARQRADLFDLHEQIAHPKSELRHLRMDRKP